MLTEICAELRNYFLRDYYSLDKYIHSGVFVIADGQIQSLPFLKPGQYYRIVGSTFNDGVWKYGDTKTALVDEEFTGTIWEMFVPPAFLDLCKEIEDWCTANAAALSSPYTSESYVAYSRTLKSGVGGAVDGGVFGWQTQFANRLKKYRRLREI